MKGKYVVVRTYSAGVHIGTLVTQKGKEVTLKNARRLWSWQGALSLSEVSQNGVNSGSRISVVVPSIALTEAIEIIPCSKAAHEKLSKVEAYKC